MGTRATIWFRPTRKQDVDIVLQNLASRTLAEIDRFLHNDPPGERISIIRTHVISSMMAERSDTFLIDGSPVGIITHTLENDYHYTTALPMERCFQRDFLRISRRYNKELAERLGTSLRAYSRSEHVRVAAWFSLLGFAFKGWDGDARVFVFENGDTM